ncbi:hypothetical protein M427DRAFT_31429 [Gonapodya prolifera JEL478]|uniref:Uncharacterized protein n=1 Tax=Gonapodya prolifera (strain JEL478) TaxID=1344416 RepID=A0A139AHN4_GONPJ|nr:hypothetical protein M427DRAFT_31429 [Gonapodya prolifera JEL478]|eukprot:KXS16270.1 hypothetical protein M427DRAFT_31429 [Gonapodya prolifera JEL478]
MTRSSGVCAILPPTLTVTCQDIESLVCCAYCAEDQRPWENGIGPQVMHISPPVASEVTWSRVEVEVWVHCSDTIAAPYQIWAVRMPEAGNSQLNMGVGKGLGLDVSKKSRNLMQDRGSADDVCKLLLTWSRLAKD